MAKWLVRTFTTEAGGKPVEEWVRSLDPTARAEVLRTVDLLRKHGTAIGMPTVRFMGNGLWELRARDPNGIYRLIYFHWKGRTFGLLHGFTKRTRATPRREIDLARARRDTWISRRR